MADESTSEQPQHSDPEPPRYGERIPGYVPPQQGVGGTQPTGSAAGQPYGSGQSTPSSSGYVPGQPYPGTPVSGQQPPAYPGSSTQGGYGQFPSYPSQQYPYGQPGSYPTADGRPPMNVLALVGFIMSLVGVSLVGIILGHVALPQIKRTGERGRGLAIAALVIGYLSIALSILGVILILKEFPDYFDVGTTGGISA